MESYSTNTDDNYLDNVNYVLDNLRREYKNGFDSLKEMLSFAKQWPLMIDSHKLEQLEYKMACVDNNLKQLDSHYKTICADSQNKDDSFDLSSNSKCWSATYADLDYNYNNSQSNGPDESAIASSHFDYELEPVYCDSTPNNDKLSSIDYLLTLNDGCDLLDFIKSDEPDNLSKIPNDNHLSDNNNQEYQDKNWVYFATISDDSQLQKANQTLITKNRHKVSRNKSATKASRNNGTKCSKTKSAKCFNNCSKKSRLNEIRVWYKCGWEGCSFGSYYNGVVKRHNYKRHSGKIKIDKSSNSAMHRFKCDWPGCEVSLVAYHKLVEHKRKHTGEKPFRCKWKSCNYATARLYSMIIHERTHKLDQLAE